MLLQLVVVLVARAAIVALFPVSLLVAAAVLSPQSLLPRARRLQLPLAQAVQTVPAAAAPLLVQASSALVAVGVRGLVKMLRLLVVPGAVVRIAANSVLLARPIRATLVETAISALVAAAAALAA